MDAEKEIFDMVYNSENSIVISFNHIFASFLLSREVNGAHVITPFLSTD
jgi:hypothetical protein